MTLSRTKAPFNVALYAAALTVMACSTDAGGGRDAVVADSASITIVNNDITRNDDICEIGTQPVLTIGAAEGNAAYELSRVFGASQLSDGRIVLVNQGSHELRFYDSAGRHLFSRGRGGRGPGEFQNAFQLWVLPGDTMYVGDYRPWQFHVFAPDGRWLRTVRPTPTYPNPPGVAAVFDDGRSLLATRTFSSPGQNWSPRNVTVVMHAPDGALLDTIGTYENGRWGTVGDASLVLYPLFESFARIDASGQVAVIAHSSESQYLLHTVQEVPRVATDAGPTIELTRIVRWDAGSRIITTEDVEAERRRIAEPYDDMDAARRGEMVGPLISTERPVAERFPAFTSLRIARDGRVWVRDFVRPTDPPANRWLIFDGNGSFACHAVLPEKAEVLEIGTDYVLTLIRDDLGVERVHKYSVGGPRKADN